MRHGASLRVFAACWIVDLRNALAVEGRGSSGRLGPIGYGPAGCSETAMERKRSACGQAAAKARRTREAVSMTRAPSLRRRRRRVANSAVARSRIRAWGRPSRRGVDRNCVASPISRTAEVAKSGNENLYGRRSPDRGSGAGTPSLSFTRRRLPAIGHSTEKRGESLIECSRDSSRRRM